jgi:predicted alpha/beta hydrolase family esterase
MSSKKLLIVPGYDNSGPEHWQTWLEKRFPGSVRVHQRDWLDADCNEWVERLNDEINRFGDDVILVGHSCGTMATVFWGARYQRSISGALLVAPTDTELDNLPEGIRGFRPIPRSKLPFHSIVVGSENDPYMDFERGRQFADDWGAEYISAGNAGHINTAAGFGEWKLAEDLVSRLLSQS